MRLIAGTGITLALLLSVAMLTGPAHADDPPSDEPTTLSDVLQALERYYNHQIDKPALDATVTSYKEDGGANSSVDVDSVSNPPIVPRGEFWDAYRDFHDRDHRPNCANADRPRQTSQMLFQGYAWQCNNGQWRQIGKRPPLFLCEQFWERNRTYPQHTYVPPNCPPEPQPE